MPAKGFQRKRWRRPQRLTLEGPPPARRKDVTVPQLMTLEPPLVWHDNRRRMAVLLLGFTGLSAVEGLLAGLAAGAPWVFAPAAGLAVAYIVVGARFGDGWMRTVLRAAPCDAPATANVLGGLAREAAVPVPELLQVPGEAPNAISLGLRRRWVCLTDGAYAMGRLEQEALLAHELIHLSRGDAALASAFVLIGGAPELATKALRAPAGVLALLSVPLWPACLLVRIVGRWLIPDVREHRADVCGAMLTRYPPGMRKFLRAASVEQSDSRLRATDGFWAAPRTPAGERDLERRELLVSEM